MTQFNLVHYQQFKDLLDDYKVSPQAVDGLQGLRVVLLVAATSTGKNTLIRRLLQSGEYYFLVSDTTRPPRVNDGVMEQSGVEYWFRSEEEVLADLQRGEYIEAELIHAQQVSGVSIRELRNAKKADKIAITDVDPLGVRNIKNAIPAATAVLLVPPSFEEWQRRMATRGQMSDVEVRRRLETARRLFDDALSKDYYQFIIAEDVVRSAQIVNAVAHGRPNPHQETGRKLLQQINAELGERLDQI